MGGRAKSRTSNRSRASKACQRCNQKRVKCDATLVGLPCSRCKSCGYTDCALIDSRRGQYPRKKQRLSTTEIDDTVVSSPPSSLQQEPCEHGSQNGDITLTHGTSKEKQGRQEPTQVTGAAQESPSQLGSTCDPPPYRDLSWAAMFDHFLDSRQNHRQDVVDKCSITYLGESFPLALVLDDLKDGDKTRLHHPGLPMDASASPGDPSSASPHPLHVRPEELAFLKAKHAFELPERPVLDALMDVFLNRFYPLYPLVNRLEFAEQYHNHNLPWILVHACCFVAATFCAETLIHQAGFTSRREARSAFYNKAKALFDLGYELNKIIVLQSVFMLTFWGGGPNDYWNFYSWIGTGVTIAEKLGIHRSLAGTNMPEKDRSLLKRLWWLLVVRDASCATLVGLPFRINMEHGDVEMLTLEDFQHDGQDETFQRHPLRSSYAQYQIQVAKLSLILYDVDYARFVPGQKKITIEEVYSKMQTWRQEIPAELEWTNDPSHTRLLATCLSILHDHHLMLAGLGRDGGRNAFNGLELATSGHDLGQAALRISNAASGIVTRSQALCAPHETYQGIFLAGIVSYVEMRSGHATLAQLGQLVVSNCQMVLHYVREAWDPSPWVLALFEKLTCSIGSDSQQTIDTQSSIAYSSHVQAPFDFGSFSGIDEPFGGYSGFGTPLQSNPMLSALFDFPQAAGIG